MFIRLKPIKSGFGGRPKPAPLRGFSPDSLGQHCPRHCPGQPGADFGEQRPIAGRPGARPLPVKLGPPLDIRGVAALIGCSPWSVRRPHPQGPAALPLQGQRQIGLLPGSSDSLDRKPTARRKKNKVSLFKRGGVYWSYFYRDGIRHQYSTGSPNRKQAETIETKLKEDINKQRFQIAPTDLNMTFGELAARFMAGASVRPHHLYHLKFLLPFFSEFPVVRLTKSLTEEFRKRRHFGKTIKDATVNRDLSVLRHILYWAVDEQLLRPIRWRA